MNIKLLNKGNFAILAIMIFVLNIIGIRNSYASNVIGLGAGPGSSKIQNFKIVI